MGLMTDAGGPGGPGPYLSLFTSVGTLVCCALPSLFVVLGFGATVASVLTAAPWLVALSRHKAWVFAVAGLTLAANLLYLQWLGPRLAARVPCPSGDERACAALGRRSRVLLAVSGGLYLTALFVAYGLGPLLAQWDQ